MSKAQNSKSKQTSGSECKHIREYINQKQSGTDAIKTLKENSTVEKIVNFVLCDTKIDQRKIWFVSKANSMSTNKKY